MVGWMWLVNHLWELLGIDVDEELGMQSAPFNIAASQTDAILVPGAPGKVIAVMGLAVMDGAAATNITFNSKGAGAGTPISMVFQNGANGGFILPPLAGVDGWCRANPGESLTCTTGAGSVTGIQLLYDVR